MKAAGSGRTSVVSLLLEYGVHVDWRNNVCNSNEFFHWY